MRARFRDSYSSPQPLVPNQVTRVRFTLNDVFHTFQRRHRLMVQVRLMRPDADGRLRPAPVDQPFELALCA